MNKLEVKDVRKQYKSKHVLKGISFAVEDEFHFIAGKNGAGKTTIIKCALGLEKLNAGKILYNNQEFEKNREDVAVVFDRDNLYLDMTGKDNIKIFCGKYLKDVEKYNDLMTALDLSKELLNKKVRQYSFGQNHRLCVAMAMLKTPRFLFLDEPTIGLDPVSWDLIKTILIEYKEKYNTCAIITGQDYEEMQSLCDSISILNKGKIIYSGKMEELINSYPKEISFYFVGDINILESLLDKFNLKDILITLKEGEYKLFLDRKDADIFANELSGIRGIANLVIKNMSLKEIFMGMVGKKKC